jgi:serine protease Do
MDDTERLPCVTCGEKAALAAQMCLHCGASLLVDVTLRAPIADSRVRYRVARALQALPGAPALAEIQNALVAKPPAAARKVTRAFAHAALAVLTANGLAGSLERSPDRRPGSAGFSLGMSGKAAAAAVLVVFAYFAWVQLLRNPTDQPERKAEAPAATRSPRKAPVAAPAGGAAPLSTRELAQRSLPATVSLRCSNSVGSGFFVTPELVVTNAHVLCPQGQSIQVGLADDRKLVGEVVKSDANIDLGLVRVAGANARPLPLGDVADLGVGDKVMIIGSPVGLDFTVHEGSVSSLQRSAYGVALVQLDAKISPGNSGGPVIDNHGRVVAVVSMKLAGRGVEGIGLALPINYVYSELRFVPPPAGGAASEAFTKMLARAKDESGGETREARTADSGEEPSELDEEKPMLVAGYLDQYQRLVVQILRVADHRPRFEEISVKVWSGSEAFCTIKGDVSDWKPLDERAPQSAEIHKLKKMIPGRNMFVGESPLRLDLCDRTKLRSGIQLELEGANLAANRLRLR